MATVPEIIAGQVTQANDYIDQAQEFVNAVAELANTQITVPIPSFSISLHNFTTDALDKINNQKPTRPDLSAIEALAPDAPIIAFRDIDQTTLDAVKALILNDMALGSYGIDPGDEAALLQRTRDREAQVSLAEEEEVVRSYAEGGFSLPQGALLVARAKARQAAAGRISSVNRDIYVKRADQFVQARQFTIQQALRVQEVLHDLHRAVTAQAAAITAIFGSQIEKYRADVSGQSEILRANLGIYEGDIRAFVASIQAISEGYKLRISENDVNNTFFTNAVRASIEAARVELGTKEVEGRIRNSAAQFGAKFYGDAIISALGSINTLASQNENS